MGDERLVEPLRRVARITSRAGLDRLVSRLRELQVDDWHARRLALIDGIHHPGARVAINQLVDRWRDDAPHIAPISLALTLRALAEERHDASQQLELVWTGPIPDGIALRRTDQALLEIIERASSELLIASFAVYRVREVVDALIAAAERGVRITLVFESPTESADGIAFDGARALGRRVIEHTRLLIWPRERRPRGARDQVGSLHVKCAIADAVELFVSSANLTEHALRLNMELGILVRGGDLPGKASELFHELERRGDLVPTTPFDSAGQESSNG